MELRGLDDKQLEAVKATEGKARIIAGAGSGKTRVLAYMYALLIDELTAKWNFSTAEHVH